MKIEFINEVYDLPLFAQYESIPYERSCGCRCGHGSVLNTHSYKLVGYCETNHGFMGIMECNACLSKHRHHVAGFGNRYDVEEFKDDASLVLHLQSPINA